MVAARSCWPAPCRARASASRRMARISSSIRYRVSRARCMASWTQIPGYRLARDVAIEKILTALATTRGGLGNSPATP